MKRRMKDEGGRMKKRPVASARADSSFILYPSSLFRAAFTLSEIMVVIVIIVLLLALAVPAFNLIRGSRSVEGTENQIAALLGRARADAIGLQKPFGIMFFINDFSPVDARATGSVYATEVYAADYPESGSPSRDVYLDIVPDTE